MALALCMPMKVFGWDFVTERGGTAVYIDKNMIQKKGKFSEAVWLSNFREAQRLRYGGQYISKNSIVYHTLFDCEIQNFKVLGSVWYDSKFGRGNGHTLALGIRPQWRTPEQKSSRGNLKWEILKLACN